MAETTTVWNELVLQARLKYLAFKRSIVLMEVCVLLLSALVMFVVGIPAPWFAIVLLVQLGKVVGEHWNHLHLSRLFGAPDLWTWFPLFCLALAAA